MSSGCACGTVTGSQLVLGYLFGRNNKFGNNVTAREKAGALIEEFKKETKLPAVKFYVQDWKAVQEKNIVQN